MLTIKEVLIQSTRLVYQNLKFIILFWTTSIIFAAALSLPLFALVHDHISHSTINNELVHGFDYVWFIQFMTLYQKSTDTIPILLYAVTGIYLFIQQFYTGGLLAVFINKKKNHHVDFFYGGVKYFIRFTKIALMSMVLYFVAFSINSLMHDLIVMFIIPTGSELLLFFNQLGRYLIFLLIISVINIVSDYSKVASAVNDSTKAFYSIIVGLRFVKKNFFRVLIMFLIVASFVAIGGLVYNIVESFVPKTPIYMLIVTFIIQQMLIILRFLIRMIFYSTELILFNDLSAEVIRPAVEEVSGV
ncbi:MAG TPA: hypothetical protein PK559_11135 [Ignavibacteriaceae bacterium]|nr:hypothetical protein [Ignavibacteriaceae bacterium]